MSLLVPVPYEMAFRVCGLKHSVPWTMMAGMAREASGFKPAIMGPTDDRGLMQVIGSNAAGCGTTPEGLFDPKTNVCCAASLLKKHFDRVKPYVGFGRRADLWRIVMFANNMGYGNTKGFLDSIPKPVTWEKFKIASAAYPGKHAWVEKMFKTANGYWWQETSTWVALTLGFGILGWYAFQS